MNILFARAGRKILDVQFLTLYTEKRTLLNFLNKTSAGLPYVIERPKIHEHDQIVREMYRSYYPDEPVSFYLKFRCDPKLDELTYDALAENISVVLKCRYTGELLAAAINKTTNPWDPNLLDRIACTLCSKAKNILHLRAHLMRAHDLWNYYKVPKIFDLQVLYVKREERRQCIPWHLITASRNIAADCGYSIFRIISTSDYLHRVCKRYRMHKSYVLPYCSYVGSDWRPVCEPPPPHFTARVYVDTNPHLPIKKIEELIREGKLYQ